MGGASEDGGNTVEELFGDIARPAAATKILTMLGARWKLFSRDASRYTFPIIIPFGCLILGIVASIFQVVQMPSTDTSPVDTSPEAAFAGQVPFELPYVESVNSVSEGSIIPSITGLATKSTALPLPYDATAHDTPCFSSWLLGSCESCRASLRTQNGRGTDLAITPLSAHTINITTPSSSTAANAEACQREMPAHDSLGILTAKGSRPFVGALQFPNKSETYPNWNYSLPWYSQETLIPSRQAEHVYVVRANASTTLALPALISYVNGGLLSNVTGVEGMRIKMSFVPFPERQPAAWRTMITDLFRDINILLTVLAMCYGLLYVSPNMVENIVQDRKKKVGRLGATISSCRAVC